MMQRISYLALMLLLSFHAYSQNGITVSRWVSGIAVPLGIEHCGDQRLFIIEKGGKIRIIENNRLLDTVFLDITSKVRSSGGEQGLLGLAFHPDYLNNGYFFVNYTNRGNPTQTVIERYQRDPNHAYRADSTSGKALLTITQPFSNHNGGCIRFGKDGYLYIGMGDGGSANDPQNNGQNKRTLLGKMLRLDINTSATQGYVIPPSNPFVGDTAYAPEIWASGLRNPWRYSFDKLNGDLWIGDVGQGQWEEIDYDSFGSPAGRNFGWRCYEGKADFNTSGCNAKASYTFPLHDYLSDENVNGCSVTGGYVYRGDRHPSLYGKYIYGDYCSGKIWMIQRAPDNSYTNRLVYDFTNSALVSFGEDLAGNLYFADVSSGSIYKIGDTCRFNFKVLATDPVCAGANDGSAMTDLADPLQAKFLWSTGDTTASVSKLEPGSYQVRVQSGNCISEQRFVIREPARDTACLTPPFATSICASDSAVLIACDQPEALGYLWYRDGQLFDSLSGKRIWIKGSGNYHVVAVDSNACPTAASTTITIVVHPLPETPQLVLQGDTLSTLSGYESYRWFFNGQLLGSSTLNFWIATMQGDYSVQVIDSNLCQSLLSNTVAYVPVSNDDPNLAIGGIYLYPNPVDREILLHRSDPHPLEALSWQLNNIDQKTVGYGKIPPSAMLHRIDVSGLPPGIYYLKIKGRGIGERILRVVKSQ
ncbi:MAG TPA: PQQ-dependent sugar dehydrogenase [Saprospiraceae bacterium]|nr:PQQ-dependent sugar dehydrogenase [Saprospiraceae bacterium]